MSIRLTQTVQKGGCAAKISADVLREALGKLNITTDDKNVLIDGKDFDDAGIYKITEDIALVQTLDFFTPIVDSPKLFGEIAAANALSDVYAMGGIPKTAMCILAFPLATLDPSIMGEVLEGAYEKIRESNASLVGGHSIDDDTLKFGLSVTGVVDPKKMWTNKGAQAGDQLILTKALGTGTLSAGLKRSVYTEDDIREALNSMKQLNAIHDLLTPELMNEIHAGTDVTGFGLSGHGMQMAKASEVTLAINFASLPILPMAFESLEKEHLTKAHRTNREYTKNHLTIEKDFGKFKEQILFDPQTSGGLLLSVSPQAAPEIVKLLKSRFHSVSIIGSVEPWTSHHVRVN
jgi:selenide,water dikinase